MLTSFVLSCFIGKRAFPKEAPENPKKGGGKSSGKGKSSNADMEMAEVE